MTEQSAHLAWVTRLRKEIPNVVAILLKGSHARGSAELHSDIDFDVLVDREPHEEYLAFFEESVTGQLRHISVAIQDLSGWMAGTRQPVSWGYGLPAAETTQLLWAQDDMLRTQLDRSERMHPPEEPDLEDFIEAWGKMRNALRRGDDLAMRITGQKLARLGPGLLRPLNPEVRPSNRREALRTVLDFPVAPNGYRDDLLRCFGLAGEEVTMQELHDAGQRITFGTVALLQEHADRLRELLPHDLYTHLTDGTLDRYIRQ